MTFSAGLLEGLLYSGIVAIGLGVLVLGFVWFRDARNKRLW